MAEQYPQVLPVEERRVASTEIRIRIPHPSSTLVNNVLGVLGLVAIIVAVGGLAGWLWALGVAGIFAVTLCLIGSTYAPAALPPAELADGEREAPTGPTVAAVPRSA
jgi:hypothetical protein